MRFVNADTKNGNAGGNQKKRGGYRPSTKGVVLDDDFLQKATVKKSIIPKPQDSSLLAGLSEETLSLLRKQGKIK